MKKTNKNSNIKIVKLELFPYDIMVATECTVEQIKDRIIKFGIKLDAKREGYLRKSGLAHTIQMPNRAVLIYFVNKPSPGLVAHEVFHAVWMILATMGVEPSVESEEVYAYMIEYITNQII